MKTIRLRYLATFALLAAALSTGCKKYDLPAHDSPATQESVGGTLLTIKQLKTLYTGQATTINEDYVIAGRVVSTDAYGNFYRSFYIQDETSGIEIKIGTHSGINYTYKVGQEVFVKLYHLTVGGYHGMVSVGYASGDSRYENTWLDVPLLINNSLFRGDIYTPLLPTPVVSSDELTSEILGMYVNLVDATYQGGELSTWAKKPDPSIPDDPAAYGEQKFRLADGTDLIVRTSGYASFADNTVPFTIGQHVDIAGIITKYNTTYQLILNTDKDAVAR